MRKALSVALLAATALLLPAPGPAAALKLVPPGNSAVNQYTDTLPGPGGNKPSADVKGGGSPAKALGGSNAARLQALGPEGRAAARLAAATASHAAGRGGPGAGRQATPGGSSGIGEVLGQATGASGSGGTGLLLPLVIVLALAGSVVFFVARRRAAHGPG